MLHSYSAMEGMVSHMGNKCLTTHTRTCTHTFHIRKAALTSFFFSSSLISRSFFSFSAARRSCGTSHMTSFVAHVMQLNQAQTAVWNK